MYQMAETITCVNECVCAILYQGKKDIEGEAKEIKYAKLLAETM